MSASSSATRSSLANGGNDSARVSELQSEVETMREQIRRMEAENKDLHRRLADAQTRRPSADGAGTGDAGTQQELKQAKETITSLRQENASLHASVHDLRNRLQNAEPMDGELSSHEEVLSLKKQLLKAKRDKDKALKLVIHLIGKDKLADYLQRHNREDNVLDHLVATFGGGAGAPAEPARTTRPRTTPSKSTSTFSPHRSRIDQYFYMASNH